MFEHPLDYALFPRSIAVLGASENPTTPGYNFLRHLIDYEYDGLIYPINRTNKTVQGLKAYVRIKDIPGAVDYLICCIPAEKILDALADCNPGQVKMMHLFTARFSETGCREAALLEKKILEKAGQKGIRLIGPNCMGIYHPKQKIAFSYDFPREPGTVGMISQSGGAATELIRYAALKGVTFSKVISYGNAVDLNESDMLAYLLEDEETKVIACYIEGIKDGRRFFNLIKTGAAEKPIILLKAGRSRVGRRAAASHTAAMAGSFQIWTHGIRQTGAIQVNTLESLVNAVVAFSFLTPLRSNRLGIVGGSGGTSVLSADIWEESGFSLPALSPFIVDKIKDTASPIWWQWIDNPVDASIMPYPSFKSELFQHMVESPDFDMIIVNMTVSFPRGKDDFIRLIQTETSDAVKMKKTGLKPIAVIMNTGALNEADFDHWRWRLLAAQKARLVREKIPVYAGPEEAAESLSHLFKYYGRQE